jgi:type II secretion system protein J
MNIQKTSRHRIAFTLIEIMVAVAIFSLVMIAVYSSWSMIVNGRDMGLKAAAEAQRSRMTMHALESALFGARMFQQNAHHHAFVVDTTDPDAAAISFVSYLPRSFPGSGLLGYQPLRRVEFVVQDGENQGKELVLYQKPMLQQIEYDQEPIKMVLARNVASFRLQFWDPVNAEWLEEWRRTNELPRQVNIALALKTDDGNQLLSVDVRTVSIPSITIPAEYQMPRSRQQPGEVDPGQLPENEGEITNDTPPREGVFPDGIGGGVLQPGYQ